MPWVSLSFLCPAYTYFEWPLSLPYQLFNVRIIVAVGSTFGANPSYRIPSSVARLRDANWGVGVGCVSGIGSAVSCNTHWRVARSKAKTTPDVELAQGV